MIICHYPTTKSNSIIWRLFLFLVPLQCFSLDCLFPSWFWRGLRHRPLLLFRSSGWTVYWYSLAILRIFRSKLVPFNQPLQCLARGWSTCLGLTLTCSKLYIPCSWHYWFLYPGKSSFFFSSPDSTLQTSSCMCWSTSRFSGPDWSVECWRFQRVPDIAASDCYSFCRRRWIQARPMTVVSRIQSAPDDENGWCQLSETRTPSFDSSVQFVSISSAG